VAIQGMPCQDLQPYSTIRLDTMYYRIKIFTEETVKYNIPDDLYLPINFLLIQNTLIKEELLILFDLKSIMKKQETHLREKA
jgi:hypothetical protein